MRLSRLWFGLVVLTASIALAPLEGSAQQAILLLRHAEQTPTGGMMEGDPPLNEHGQRRADQLSSLLKDAGIAAIYSSQYTRARQTVEPLAQAVGRDIRVIQKDDLAGLAARLSTEHAGEVVLVVAHSDTIPKLLAALGHAAPVEIGRSEFNNLWFIVPRADNPPLVSRLKL
ncbi:SixA phosphatase family protein [Bosea vaviloviae]|nr:phosphoglycerate mutase family protein [Bosea vaviloviae]